ncbi:hypothetical protein MXB_3389 [Myxobolus squamalis]|nr:hypothetical protein MXB_3389 [Myxobolus squamalis]
MSNTGDIDKTIDSFCPKRRNLVDINQFECLFCFSQVAKTVIKHLNQQTDEYFFKRRLNGFSGNYPSDYISEKSLKPFIVEPVKEFSSPEIAEIDYTLPIHGYIPEINRCWFYHENSIHFCSLKKPYRKYLINSNTSYICYPIRQKVKKIFLFPAKKSEPGNRLLYICALIFKASVKIYSATLQNADRILYFKL